MRSFLTMTLILAWSGLAMADAAFYTDQYHTLQTVELYELAEDSEGNQVEILQQKHELPDQLDALADQMSLHNKSGQGLGDILIVTKNLIALGKEIYKIIEAGKPVLTMESAPVSVLPRDEKGNPVDAFHLSNWSAPKAKKYKVVAKNYLGMRPVSFEFMLIFSHGGKYDNKGAYLTGAQIKATDVQVGWGYNMDANFQVQSIVNQGSAESPVAGAVLMIDYTIKTVVKETKQNRTFFVNGLGHTQAY